MRFTPRQIVVRAQETAYQLLATLDREALVARFLQSYAKDHNRMGVITQPAIYGDLMACVRREALLAMVTHVDEALPRRLGLGNPSKSAPKKKASKARGKRGTRGARKKSPAARPASMTGRELAAHAAVLNLFREEFIVALGRAQRWSEEESGEFARDYDLYEATRSRAGAERSGGGARNISSGPFVDRCGLLLDPSMLEQARRAAGRFQAQLQATAEGVLKRVFSARRQN
ncbi:MAG: hypothetical protein WA766_09565 [Candidatus Acidiferrales bacterium]|jgi:hypothetical protein